MTPSDHQAWISSLIVHTVLFLAIALVARPLTHGSSISKTGTSIGIELAQEVASGHEFAVDDAEAGSTAAAGGAKIDISVSPVADQAGPPISVDGLMADMIGNNNGTGPVGMLGDGSLGDGLHGTGRGRGSGTPGSPTKTSFMGVEGVGTSFVYVLDRSDSMNGYDGAPLRYAKSELVNSIASLQENNQFQVVFYNDSPAALSSANGNGGKLLFATDIDKQRATSFVRRLSGSGSTQHVPAIKLGLSMGANVMFFMTDADEPAMSPTQLAEIQHNAERSGTTIHTIQFNAGPATTNGGWIRALAEMNRGKYRYVDITTLNISSLDTAKSK